LFEPEEQIGWPFSCSPTSAVRLARKSRDRFDNEGVSWPAADRQSALRALAGIRFCREASAPCVQPVIIQE